MMSSGKSSGPRMGTPRRTTKKSGVFQYVMFFVVVVLVIIIIAVVAFGGNKKSATKSERTNKSRSTAVARGDGDNAPVTGRKVGKDVRTKRLRGSRQRVSKPERVARRQERSRLRERETGRVTVRSSRGGYTSRKSGVPVLKAIISDPAGGRVAVVGDRRVKPGDQIEGRRITEVGPDRVKVEYFTKTYEVKINQPIY